MVCDSWERTMEDGGTTVLIVSGDASGRPGAPDDRIGEDHRRSLILRGSFAEFFAWGDEAGGAGAGDATGVVGSTVGGDASPEQPRGTIGAAMRIAARAKALRGPNRRLRQRAHTWEFIDESLKRRPAGVRRDLTSKPSGGPIADG